VIVFINCKRCFLAVILCAFNSNRVRGGLTLVDVSDKEVILITGGLLYKVGSCYNRQVLVHCSAESCTIGFHHWFFP